MTKYKVGWIAGVLLCLLCCILTESYAGVYLVAGLTFLLLCSVLVTVLNAGAPAVHIDIPGNCRKNQRIRGVLRIRKQGLLPLFKVEVELSVRNLMTGEVAVHHLITGLSGKSASELPFEIQSELCGCVQIAVTGIKAYDVTGIWKKGFITGAKAQMVVLPDTFAADIQLMPGLLSDNESIEYSGEKPGEDTSEIFGIREYMPGDNIKNIHWKLTGKCDELMVRLPSLPMENSILLMYETSDGADEAAADRMPQVYDALAEIFITLSQTLLHNNISHEIAWYDHSKSALVSFIIEQEEDLLGALGKILSSPHVPDEKSAYEHYVKEHGAIGKAHVVYITSIYSGEFEAVSDEIRKTVIICSNTQTIAAENGQYQCNPDNYAQELHYLYI